MMAFSTVSVLGSIMLWLGYRIFFIANNNQPTYAQAKSLEEDNNQPNLAQAKSLEEFLSLSQEKLQTSNLQEQSIPSLPQGLLDDKVSKSVKDNFQNKQQSRTPFIEDVPSLPLLPLDDRTSKLIQNNYQNKPEIKAPQIENDPSSLDGPNRLQTFSSLLPVVLNDKDILKEGSQNGQQAKSSLLQDTNELLQVLLGNMENRVLENDRNNLPTEIPQVQSVSNFRPFLDDVSNVLEGKHENKRQNKMNEAENIPSLLSVVLDDKGKGLKEKDQNKEPTEIPQIQHVPRVSLVILNDILNDVLAGVNHEEEQANLHQLLNVPDVPIVSQDMDSKALKVGEIQQDLHSNADLYKVAEARSLFDLVDNDLNDLKPEIETSDLDDFHKSAYKEVPPNEDHSESDEEVGALESNHTYEDDLPKVHKKLKIFKSNKHKFSLFDILKVPGFGEHKLPNLDANKNPPKIYLNILHTVLSYVEYENAVEFNAIDPGVSDVPQTANESNANNEDEVTSDNIDVESLSGNYMSRIDWEAQAVIGVSVVVVLLLVVSIILFICFYCKRRKRRRYRKKNGDRNNK
ncbi:uncharacterized protein [Palaemon carinicauda]|uniref:uncharacterized protein n=1 Tax=Palaemon carinicauda TaxID=392227 RepID=UPI0035B5D8EB